MGPTAEALTLADKILADHPGIAVDRYSLAYSIDAWCDESEKDEQP